MDSLHELLGTMKNLLNTANVPSMGLANKLFFGVYNVTVRVSGPLINGVDD